MSQVQVAVQIRRFGRFTLIDRLGSARAVKARCGGCAMRRPTSILR